ncbi:MAG: hypothetical protein GY951_08720, partial [Psychromonas sp.]|nr:hypothetical protein [Psychromonas sp.]
GLSNPSISVNYLGNKLPIVGYWSIETVVDFLDSDFKYLSSTRLMVKPVPILEFGATYQLTEKDDLDNNLNQYGIDGRLSLPSFSNLYHGMFASITSFDYEQQTNANIIGWDGQFNLYENSVRIVVEKQSVDGSQFKRFTDKQRFQHAEINSLQWGDSLSLAFYLQFINDHKMSLIYRDSEVSSYYQEQSLQLDYRFPLTIGQFHLGLGQSDVTLRSSKNSETNFWGGYEL